MKRPFLFVLALLAATACFLLLNQAPGSMGGWRGGPFARLALGKGTREAPVRVPLPRRFPVEFVVYFRPEGRSVPGKREICARVKRWLDGHAAAPVRPALRALVDRGLLEYRVVAKGTLPTPPEGLIRRGTGTAERRCYERATRVMLLGMPDVPGPPHLGLWCAIAASRAAAAAYRGVIVDPDLTELLPIASYNRPLPADLRLRVSEHITVPYSVDERGLGWMTTSGMRKLGLPDLQIKDFPPNLAPQLCTIMNGMAHYLLAALADQTRARRTPAKELVIGPEIRLDLKTISAEAHSPLKLLPCARGWSNLRLRYDPGKHGESSFLTLLPPRDFRGEQGVWLDQLTSSLFGSEDPMRTVPPDSAAMEAAHQRAVKELPAVKRRFQMGLRPGEILWVKHGFPTEDGGDEYMWIVVHTWTGRRLSGHLDNDPQMRHDLRAGQTVQLDESNIFDWMLRLPGGRQEGAYTTAVVEREGTDRR